MGGWRPPVTTQSFSDFDAYAGSIRDADGRIMLTRREESRWEHAHLKLNRVSIQWGHERGGAIFEGTARPGGCLLFVDTTCPATVTANGRQLDRDDVVVIGHRAEVCLAAARSRHDWFTVFIPNDLLAAQCEQYGFDADVYARSCHVLRQSPENSARLRGTIRNLELTSEPRSLEGPLGAAVESQVLSVALNCLRRVPAPVLHERGKSRPVEGVVRAVLRRVDAATTEARVPLHTLAEAVGVSDRTLRNAFNDYFGVGLTRYLRLRLLHQVRRALEASDRETSTVTRVEASFGVSEFGRFAHEYEGLFGETPSHTLRHRREVAGTGVGGESHLLTPAVRPA
jgi:AraC family ethanolamine operon transcriptional activator